MAQYLCPNSWLFCPTVRGKPATKCGSLFSSSAHILWTLPPPGRTLVQNSYSLPPFFSPRHPPPTPAIFAFFLFTICYHPHLLLLLVPFLAFDSDSVCPSFFFTHPIKYHTNPSHRLPLPSHPLLLPTGAFVSGSVCPSCFYTQTTITSSSSLPSTTTTTPSSWCHFCLLTVALSAPFALRSSFRF